MARTSTIAAILFVAAATVLPAAAPPENTQEAVQLMDDGNFQEALDQFRRLLGDTDSDAKLLVDSYNRALQCFQRLNRVEEIDELREAIASTHADNWQVLTAIAASWMHQQHHGYQIAGEFRRGNHRGGGKVVNAVRRDRVRALQLYRQALSIVDSRNGDESSHAAHRVLAGFADAVMFGRNYGQAWRLQSLTDLSKLPDYEDGWGYQGGQPQGAAVDADGNPIFYDVPASWDSAENDGQRWRWLIRQAAERQPGHRNWELSTRAEFLLAQFSVQTLANYGWWFGRQATRDQDADTGTYALHTLEEHETIARLATGIRRFDLPDEHNPIRLYQRQAEENSSDAPKLRLATIFENRRQYDRAAENLRQCKKNARISERLKQIVANWGRFESVMSQPAGEGATVDFRFRNGKRVEFTARKIKVRQLLDDVKAHLVSSPQKLNWNELQIEQLGHRLITTGKTKYLGEEVARWSLDLEPLAQHFDRRITVTTPLQEPGAYLLTSTMADGNSTSVVIWLNDTAIVKKPLAGKSLYYVADAVTGRPVAKCNVEFFGFWQQHLDGNKYQVHIKKFAQLTDENGLLELPADENNRRHQWLAVATTPEGRFAYLGFRGIWSGDYYDQQYQQVKVFAITDRPVYRPQQQVHFKFWVRNAQFDQGDESRFAAQSFQVEIRDPRNEKAFTTQLTADTYGGLAGTWDVPSGATLGQYRIDVVNHGGGTFRVEEYKKPEFEVLVDVSNQGAPDKPVQLGDKITATISAKYYFGSPVTQATVKYKVLRTSYDARWYPPMPWDWLYGSGYWWFGQDYAWYPGWGRWGCFAPSPWWWWRQPTPPEVVAEREVALGPDGTIEIEIDTATAKQFHPDKDHRYQIQAEVVDASRRTIVGTGQVLVAREPFRVHLWTDRGYYRVGDTIVVGTSSRTLDGAAVEGTGALRLLRIRYDDAKPVETEVGRWDLATGETGRAELQVKASEPGQYRLSYELTDPQGRTREGGQVLTVTGAGFDGSEFQFNDIELVPDRREYQAGDKVALQINTNRAGAAVLLFARPANGVYLPPQLVKLEGKSTIVEIDVTAKDMPNFFVEAVTVHGGKVHAATREIFVPPASRLLNLEVVPSADTYLPGQAAKLLVKLTDAKGKPFVGSLAMAVYDKALEYIAGGSNVADIREFFWKWRRQHRSQGENNLLRASQVLVEPNKAIMRNLGIFGQTVVDEIRSSLEPRRDGDRFRSNQRAKSLGGARQAFPALAAAAEGAVEMYDSAAPPNEAVADVELVQPTVRENFADTALWVGSLETNAEGIAEVELDMPENLTTWKVRAWAVGHGTRVGEGTAEIVTRKNLIVRLQAPRFFVEKDEVVLSAIVHNYLPTDKQVTVSLELEGDALIPLATTSEVVEIEAGGEQRINWTVTAAREGTATIRMTALTDDESDAMQMSFPVHIHGMLKTESFTGAIPLTEKTGRPEENSGQFTISIPTARRPEQTSLEVRYTPTLAGAMVDALPYLIDYPYGCTEQTLNRFLPAVVTQRTLERMDLDLAAIRDKRTNLNAQEIGDDRERAKKWQRFDRNPVFDDVELGEIVTAGVNRLTQMQLADGGWGWFSGWGERSTPHTTAVVMHGLLIAKENGVAIVPSVLERGVAWLESYQADQVRRLDNWQLEDAEGNRTKPNKRYADNTDSLVHMVLTEAKRAGSSPSPATTKMQSYLYRDRTHLAVYGLATFGLALHQQGDQEKLAMVMRNLSQYVRQDDENQTAWLESPNAAWWHWYGSEYEAHAYYLKLLAATDPQSLVAPRLVKYLLNNRKHATYWNSTRDTALVVEAFADYLRATGEDDPDVTVEIWIDGQQRKQVAITRENLFTFDNKLVLSGDELSAGRHTIELRKQGESPIYFNGYLTNFTLEDDIAAAGLELKVARRYFKLTRAEKSIDVAGGRGQVVNQQVDQYERTPLVNFAELKSGDLVEVELVVDSKNDYEYIVLEDMKAAGFEPVEVRSGYNGNELGAYMELRDDRVSLFVAHLARGQHSVTYRLRAEIPGKFSALPTRASAMYAPELRANSGEMKLRIADH